MSLQDELAEAEAKVAQLRARIASGPCREFGCTMKHIGGANANCGRDHCSCSVPVSECTKCGDCDYGDTPEADRTRAECARDRP